MNWRLKIRSGSAALILMTFAAQEAHVSSTSPIMVPLQEVAARSSAIIVGKIRGRTLKKLRRPLLGGTVVEVSIPEYRVQIVQIIKEAPPALARTPLKSAQILSIVDPADESLALNSQEMQRGISISFGVPTYESSLGPDVLRSHKTGPFLFFLSPLERPEKDERPSDAQLTVHNAVESARWKSKLVGAKP